MNNTDVGVIVLGSQMESHGLLPNDTDTKLATHVAYQAATQAGARLVGIVNSAAEYEYIKHGTHNHVAVVLIDLLKVIENSMERCGIRAFVLVNGHGGNKLIKKYVPSIKEMLGVEIALNNKIVELEGAHAASEECSMAIAAGIVHPLNLNGQGDFERFPEVGFVGMKEAHVNPKIRELAEMTMIEGINLDVEFGKRLLDQAVKDVVATIKKSSASMGKRV